MRIPSDKPPGAVTPSCLHTIPTPTHQCRTQIRLLSPALPRATKTGPHVLAPARGGATGQ